MTGFISNDILVQPLLKVFWLLWGIICDDLVFST